MSDEYVEYFYYVRQKQFINIVCLVVWFFFDRISHVITINLREKKYFLMKNNIYTIRVWIFFISNEKNTRHTLWKGNRERNGV